MVGLPQPAVGTTPGRCWPDATPTPAQSAAEARPLTSPCCSPTPPATNQHSTAGAQYAGSSGLINIKRDDALLHYLTGHYLSTVERSQAAGAEEWAGHKDQPDLPWIFMAADQTIEAGTGRTEAGAADMFVGDTNLDDSRTKAMGKRSGGRPSTSVPQPRNQLVDHQPSTRHNLAGNPHRGESRTKLGRARRTPPMTGLPQCQTPTTMMVTASSSVLDTEDTVPRRDETHTRSTHETETIGLTA